MLEESSSSSLLDFFLLFLCIPITKTNHSNNLGGERVKDPTPDGSVPDMNKRRSPIWFERLETCSILFMSTWPRCVCVRNCVYIRQLNGAQICESAIIFF